MANAANFVDLLRPRDFYRESEVGYADDLVFVQTSDLPALTLPKLADQGYTALCRVPVDLTVGTGLTFTTVVTDDGKNANDLGKVIRLGLTFRLLATGADEADLDASAATEVTQDITLDATTGQLVMTASAVASAALDSIVAGSWFGLRVRRIGTHANDTLNGRALLLGVGIQNTFTA